MSQPQASAIGAREGGDIQLVASDVDREFTNSTDSLEPLAQAEFDVDVGRESLSAPPVPGIVASGVMAVPPPSLGCGADHQRPLAVTAGANRVVVGHPRSGVASRPEETSTQHFDGEEPLPVPPVVVKVS